MEWFWHVLALALGGTVAELQARMSQSEFLAWREFYRLYPFDDLHRFHRPAALISTGGGSAMQRALEWLAPDARNDDLGGADMNTLRAFGFSTRGS